MFLHPATRGCVCRGHGWELGAVSPVLGWLQSEARAEAPLVWDLNEEEAGGLQCLLTYLFSIQHPSTFLSACWNQVRLSVSISLEKESLVVFRNRRRIAPWLPWVCLGQVILGSHCILYKVLKKCPFIFSHRLRHNLLRDLVLSIPEPFGGGEHTGFLLSRGPHWTPRFDSCSSDSASLPPAPSQLLT